MKYLIFILALLPGLVSAASFTWRFDEQPASTDGYPWVEFTNIEYKATCKIDSGAYDIINVSKVRPVKFEVLAIQVGQRLTCKGSIVADGDTKPDGTVDRVESSYSRSSYVTVKDKTVPIPPADIRRPSTPINVKLTQD